MSNLDARIDLSGTVYLQPGTSRDARQEEDGTTATSVAGVAGTVRDARSSFPLSGLRVAAWMRLAAADGDTTQRTRSLLLGEATTGDDGSYRVVARDAAPVTGALATLAETPATIVLEVYRDNTRLLRSAPRPFAGELLLVDLEVDASPADLDRRLWMRAAEALASARIGRVNELARALQHPTPGGPFASWTPTQRLAALVELEAAFLDPDQVLRRVGGTLPSLAALQAPGALETWSRSLDPAATDSRVGAALADLASKVQSFQALSDVDWVLDTVALARADFAGAVRRFQDSYRIAPGMLDRIGDIFRPRRETELTRYRDYLREIWIGVGQIHKVVQDGQLTAQEAATQLAHRFHQDFYQLDVTERPANEILIDIVRQILTAPAGDRWGFGVAPATLPARGSMSAREYLDALIALSNLSPSEFGLRYRLDLARPDSAVSSRVQENIATLQAFFRDGFQATPDPGGTHPDKHGAPIVPPPLQGKAPFFLWFDEWLRQRAPFYPENHFDFRRAFPVAIGAEGRERAQQWAASSNKATEKDDWKLIVDVVDAATALREGHESFYKREFALAEAKYQQAFGALWRALHSKPARAFDIKAALVKRRQFKVSSIANLDGPRGDGTTFTVPVEWNAGGVEWGTREATRDRLALRIYYYLLYVLPLSLGDTALARGDYARATFFYGQVTRVPIGVARESDAGGYRPHYLASSWLYHLGERPYTVNLADSASQDYPLAGNTGEKYDTTTYSLLEKFAVDLLPRYAHPIEVKAARLRHGNALLEWADALYRTDEPSSVERARELYKAVLYLHGAAPPISPAWPRRSLGDGWFPGVVAPFLMHDENPAVVAQKARARAGFFKISQGLNWYGETADVVPVLRYRALREVAERFAALAKATQQDFLLYTGQMEAAMADRMRLANLIQKGGIQVKVADEQTKIAQHGVQVAAAQVQVVKDQIAAKQKELEDSQDFFSQLGDFLGGMVDVFTSLPGEATGFIGSGAKASLAGGGGAMAGLGVLGGYAAFVYAGYTSLNSMAEEYSSLSDQIKALTDKALPAAQAQQRAREREVTIAGYQRQLAEADLDLARDLLTFEERRFLGLEFWNELARLMVRLLRRYLELAARTAWLAERALAYELDRDIRVVRFDYFPERLQGVTGADLIHADLAELEAIRVESTARSVPVRVTVSLAAEHPLAFGRLKTTGACTFATTEAWLRAMYPGTHAHRIRAVSASIVQTGTVAPVRGLLVNEGVSIVRPGEPDARALVRPAEGFPISEFRLDRDLAVHGLPGDALLPFEGSAIETFWRVELPLAGNAASLGTVADVLVTFDLRASYDPARHAAQAALPPAPVRRWILMSAQRFAPEALAALAQGQTASLVFDLAAVGLSSRELNRAVTNVGLGFVSRDALDITCSVRATTSAVDVGVAVAGGVAHSNRHPDPNATAQPPMALNALVGTPADQPFEIRVDPAANPGADFAGVRDVLFAIEYEAALA